MMILRKKHLTILAVLLLVAVVGYINWSYNGSVEDSMPTTADEYDEIKESALGETTLVSATKKSDYFSEARMEREEGRSKSVETLNTIINNQNSDADAKGKAEAEVAAIAKNSDKEITIENLIKAKGFQDAVVYISESGVNVVLKCSQLSREDAVKIQEIVMEQTGLPAEQIKIVEIN